MRARVYTRIYLYKYIIYKQFVFQSSIPLTPSSSYRSSEHTHTRAHFPIQLNYYYYYYQLPHDNETAFLFESRDNIYIPRSPFSITLRLQLYVYHMHLYIVGIFTHAYNIIYIFIRRWREPGVGENRKSLYNL